jgi:hypothetical protein
VIETGDSHQSGIAPFPLTVGMVNRMPKGSDNPIKINRQVEMREVSIAASTP